jgi:hypothetical protein
MTAVTANVLKVSTVLTALLRKAASTSTPISFDVFTGSLFDGRVHRACRGKIVDQRYDLPG